MKTLCVVGAGAAGLCAVKHAVDFGFEVTAFEQAKELGGTWVYTEGVGKDKHGLDVHSSMYKGLRTNLPKEVMGYPGFPFGEGEKSFISSEEVLNYYQTFADQFKLHQFIKFEHQVVRVRPLIDDTWDVIVQDLVDKKHETHTYDAVLVCNGHFNSPSMPKIKGQNTFLGKQMHSHDYRYPEMFKDETVLVVGAGPSGIDCTIDISEFAKSVLWSNHSGRPHLVEQLVQLKDNVYQKPDVIEILPNGVKFVDESYQECSVIVYCTGYKYALPFLSADCGIKNEEYHVSPLFKHCINIAHPTMGIIGILNFSCPNQMFDLQVRFCLTFFMGQKDLPSKAEMLLDMENDEKNRKQKGFSKKKSHYIGPEFQGEYFNSLAELAEIEPIKPVIMKIYSESIFNLLNDFANFRKKKFTIVDDENYFSQKIDSTICSTYLNN